MHRIRQQMIEIARQKSKMRAKIPQVDWKKAMSVHSRDKEIKMLIEVKSYDPMGL